MYWGRLGASVGGEVARGDPAVHEVDVEDIRAVPGVVGEHVRVQGRTGFGGPASYRVRSSRLRAERRGHDAVDLLDSHTGVDGVEGAGDRLAAIPVNLRDAEQEDQDQGVDSVPGRSRAVPDDHEGARQACQPDDQHGFGKMRDADYVVQGEVDAHHHEELQGGKDVEEHVSEELQDVDAEASAEVAMALVYDFLPPLASAEMTSPAGALSLTTIEVRRRALIEDAMNDEDDCEGDETHEYSEHTLPSQLALYPSLPLQSTLGASIKCMHVLLIDAPFRILP